MDVLDNYEIIKYKGGECDKYDNERYYDDCEVHYLNGLIHRDGDKPAVIYSDGTKIWYQYGQVHRGCGAINDLPAVIYSTGMQEWYQYGQVHRDHDLPAIIYANGRQEWYQHDKLHRDNDLPAVIYSDGTQYWYKHGVRYFPSQQETHNSLIKS